MKSVVIIPTYNERENIEKLINEILELGVETEILIIDDNSPDETGKIVDRVSQQCPRVSIIHRKRKLGIGSAYLCGFKYALSKNFDYIFTMDADFSHPPPYILEFIKEIDGYDVILGSRYVAGGGIVNWNVFRRLLSKCATAMIQPPLLDPRPHSCTNASYVGRPVIVPFVKSRDDFGGAHESLSRLDIEKLCYNPFFSKNKVIESIAEKMDLLLEDRQLAAKIGEANKKWAARFEEEKEFSRLEKELFEIRSYL